MYRNGHRDYNTPVAAVFEQLHSPDMSRHKLAIVDVPPLKTSRLSSVFKIPAQGLPCTPEGIKPLRYNLTPKYTFVDIHIGMDGPSLP